MQVCKDYC